MARTQPVLTLATEGVRSGTPADWLTTVERQVLELTEQQRQHRRAMLQETAGGSWAPGQALEVLDALRWLERVGDHTWRLSNYLGGACKPEPVASEP